MFYLFLQLFFCLQVLEDGRPFLDMAHIITNLNRLDAGIPDTVSHWLVFPAKLSDWLIYASVPDTVSHWLVFPAKLSHWLIFGFTPASQTRSVIGWFFPPSLLIG
jgi:hypothetical protein